MQVSSKKAFTMIELIFVIVIIGILAAVAIPKLAATRDDAKMSAAVTNLKICVNDAGAAYTGRQLMETNASAGCRQVIAEGCFEITEVNLTALHVENNASNAETWCIGTDAAQDYATGLNLTADAPGVNHIFGGTQVER